MSIPKPYVSFEDVLAFPILSGCNKNARTVPVRKERDPSPSYLEAPNIACHYGWCVLHSAVPAIYFLGFSFSISTRHTTETILGALATSLIGLLLKLPSTT